jgi:hypothetical protein
MFNLTAIYWIKNEARYLPEWIEFHAMQGFDHFILYDNGSTDGLEQVLRPYLREGLVEIRYYPPNLDGPKNYWLMSHCIDEQKGKTKWLHFHAIDEFTFCPDGRKIPDLLKEYQDFDGLAVTWLLFNSSGHIDRPKGLVINNYQERVTFDRCLHVKTIIQPDRSKAPAPNTHWFHHLGRGAVDENFNQVVGPFNNGPTGKAWHEPGFFTECPAHYTINKIRNNHYVTRSKQEWDEKATKGLLDNKAEENTRRADAEGQWNFLHAVGYNFELNSSGWHPGFEKDVSILVFQYELLERLKHRYRYDLETLMALEIV